MNIKKLLIGVSASTVIFGVMAVVGNRASDCGAGHGAFASVNGNFGWLGDLGGTPGYHSAVGQEPNATGYNNSHLCGNPQHNF
jgi:hypothetical protein